MQMQSSSTYPAIGLAEVRAHDQVMRYHRAGVGRPLVLLRTAADPDSLWPELEEQLVTRFRVLTPDLPPDCEDVAGWMKDFLEGVGLDRVVVVAADPCCLSALELALLGAQQIERLVLVPGGLTGETGLDGTLATAYAGMSVPLLVVRRGLSAAEALPLLRQFLEHEGSSAAVG
jgi:pimeloyl-ACP methyl ester carboxylesterase